jgi:hypothetical protein
MAAVLRTYKTLAMLVAALALMSCSSSNPGSAQSPQPVVSAEPAVNADSKAADLRTRLNLLLAEHALLVIKQSSAAAAHSDEYPGYASLLITNGNDLTELTRSAFGDSGAAQFDQIWKAQNGYWIDYSSGLVTHNQNKSSGAGSGLVNGFVPQLAQYLTAMTQIPLDPTTQLLTEHVLELRIVIDDQVSQSYVKMYADLLTVFAQSARIADPLATKIVQKFPDKFPGDPSNRAVDLRVSLNLLLLEHAYLATMITDAALAGRPTEPAAGLTALASNADALGTLVSKIFGTVLATQFDQVWVARDTALVAYGGSDTAARPAAQIALSQTLVTQFASFVETSTGVHAAGVSALATMQVKAAMQVIDDQRTKAYAQVASDDRTAASSMLAIGDQITGGAASKLPGKFS